MRIVDEGRNITVEVKRGDEDRNCDLSRAIIFVADKLQHGYTLGTFFDKTKTTSVFVLDGHDKFT